MREEKTRRFEWQGVIRQLQGQQCELLPLLLYREV